MHWKAEEWDKQRGYNTSFGKEEKRYPKKTPKNRPCDWCGEVVDEGYIHDECREKERDIWFDILY